jgi:hypothetical protein
VEVGLLKELPPLVVPAGYEEHVLHMYSEEMDANVIVHLVCACDAPSFKKIDRDEYTCIHCDNPCNVVDCIRCKALDEFDNYEFPADEIGGEEDSDV